MIERVIRSREEMHDTLQMLRVGRQLTQAGVATAIGTGQSAVCSWEGGQKARVPSMENLVRLLDFYGYELVIRERKHEEGTQPQTAATAPCSE